MRRHLILACALILASAIFLPALNAHSEGTEIATTTVGNLAIGGYDAITFRTETGPQPGFGTYSYFWKGSIWQFINDENRQTFRDNPENYAPEYGGHGAWAVSVGEFLRGDPRIFTITDNRLYLFYSEGTKDKWLKNQSFLKQRAERVWAENLPGMQ